MTEWIALERLALAPVPGRVVAEDAAGRLEQPRFRARVCDWQAAFAARPETDWALYCEQAVEFAAALLGAWHAGKRVFLPGDALPATLAGLANRVDAFAGDLPDDRAPLRAVADSGAGVELAALDPAQARLVLFTSGSTGEPAAIEKRLAELSAEIVAQEAVFGTAEPVVVHGTVSHQHIYGLLHRVLWPLAAGRAIGQRLFFHEDLLRVLSTEPASWLVTSPAHLKRLPERFDWPAVHGRLRRVFSSGGALPAEAGAAAARLLGTPPVEIFGSSETGGIAWRRAAPDEPSPPWQPLPGVAWRLAGELLAIRSPHLPPDAGWWHSQDRAEADGGGGFRLLGRADRIVKIEERRVSLDALERDLRAHPAVADARVLVLAEGTRSVLAAVVALAAAPTTPLGEPDRRELAARLARHLSGAHEPVARPRRWRFVEAVPVNAQGKTPQAALAALFAPAFPVVEWLERGPAQAELAIVLDPALAVFDGHFPTVAILPGVAQVDWAIRLGREAFALPPVFLRLEVLKFQRVARPGARLRLRLAWEPARSALVFRYDSAAGVHASGRAVFGVAA